MYGLRLRGGPRKGLQCPGHSSFYVLGCGVLRKKNAAIVTQHNNLGRRMSISSHRYRPGGPRTQKKGYKARLETDGPL